MHLADPATNSQIERFAAGFCTMPPPSGELNAVIDLYTFATPNGRKISIALEEMELEYAVHSINITKGEQFTRDFLAISPNNKIPAVVDHATGVKLMESGAILVYLADTYDPTMWGTDRWTTMQWLMWQMGGLGPMLGQVHHFVRFNPGKAPYAENRYREEGRRLYGVLDQHLGKEEYVGGSYSIADIACWPWISRYEYQEMNLVDYPNVLRWYRAVAARPAVQRGYDVPRLGQSIPLPSA